MSKIFTRTYRPLYADINANGELAPAAYARYIIDAAYEWGELMGLGATKSEELGLYWVIRETEIQFMGSLQFMEEFDFSIWLPEWKRVRGTRAFIVKHKNTGTAIAQGVQQLACMDSETQRPVSPPEDLIQNFRQDVPVEIPAQRFPKIHFPPKNAFSIEIQITWQDLDILDMVNNAVYISFAEDAAASLLANSGWSPVELKTQGLARVINRLHIQYHMPAVWGDTLNITIFSLKLDPMGGSFYVDITRSFDGASNASCILDWGLVDQNRVAHPMPDALANALKGSVIA